MTNQAGASLRAREAVGVRPRGSSPPYQTLPQYCTPFPALGSLVVALHAAPCCTLSQYCTPVPAIVLHTVPCYWYLSTAHRPVLCGTLALYTRPCQTERHNNHPKQTGPTDLRDHDAVEAVARRRILGVDPLERVPSGPNIVPARRQNTSFQPPRSSSELDMRLQLARHLQRALDRLLRRNGHAPTV